MRQIFCTISFLLATFMAGAQEQKHNLDITVGGGLQSPQLSLSAGEVSPGLGWNVGANYRYMFSENVGLGAGVSLASYKANFKFDGVHMEETYTDRDNFSNEKREFTRKLDFDGFEESQSLLNLEIPVAVYFMKPINDRLSFKSELGVKLQLPVWNNCEVSKGNIVASATSALTDVDYSNLPQHNLTDLNKFEGETKLESLSTAAFIDAGVQYNQFYLGAYFSYSLTPFAKKSDAQLFDGKNYVGVLSSNIADDAKLISAGIKLGWTMEIKKRQAKAE